MGGVISKGGWLSLCGAAPRRFPVAPYNADVWREGGGTGLDLLFPWWLLEVKTVTQSMILLWFCFICMHAESLVYTLVSRLIL